MSDSCNCFDIEVEVIMDEPEIDCEIDVADIILCSDGEDYKRGYNEGHAQGLVDGQAEGYKKGYGEGYKVGSESGYTQGKQDGLTEGYDNGYEKGKQDGYNDGYEQGYSEGYTKGYEDGKAEGGEFIGVKCSDFETSGYMLPRTADARSLDKIISPNGETPASAVANCLFQNNTANPNGGLYASLTTAYMPSKITVLTNTFYNCSKLTTIIGDLSKVIEITQAFYGCKSLTELPYMPNLKILGPRAIIQVPITSITFHKVLTTWLSNAIMGCSSLTEINLVDGWNTAVYVQDLKNLSQASLHDMIEKLADMTGQTSLIFKMGETNIAKIDEEHIAMLQRKNIDYS